MSSLSGHIHWPFSIAGLLVGALIGLTGVGGGSLMTPVLMLFFGISPAMAVGTDLLYAAATKSGGVLVHGLNGTIDWRIVLRLASGSLPATVATLAVLAHWHVAKGHGHGFISTMLGAALLLTAASLMLRKAVQDWLTPIIERMGDRRRAALTVVLGVLLGVFVTISSVGAGAIGVTVLLTLYPRAPLVRVVGADIAHAVPLTLVAGLGHWALGTVDGAMLASLLIGSLPGIALASHFASRAPERLLRPIMAATLAVVGLRLAL